MSTKKVIVNSSLLFGLIGLLIGCGRGPREGDYDRDHHRYYHERTWHDCGDHDERCR